MSLYRKALSTTRAALVIVIILVVVIAGAYVATRPSQPTGPSQTSQTAAQIPETLVIDDAAWPIHNLNALYELLYVPWPWWLEHTVYQTLVVTDVVKQFGQGQMNFVPDLATDWTVSPDSTTYTYNLRQGVKFSNGDTFNAYEVWTQMYVWYYLNGNGTNFLGGLDLFDISHVKFGPTSFDLLKSSGLDNPTGAALAMMQDQSWPIYTTGPYQIVFHMKTPFLYLNGLLVGFEGLLFDCQWALQNGGFGTPATFNPYFDDHPMPGTGPYAVSEVVLNSHVKFTKNTNYWGASLSSDQLAANPLLSPGQVQNVIIYAKTDDIARYTDLSTGAAQLSAIRATNWRLVINNPQYDYFKLNTTAELTAVAFNTQIFPTNITDVRQAIAHAINYTDIWDRAYFGEAKAFVGPETPNYGVYYNPANLPPYDYNLDTAKQYLAKAGFPNGQGLPTLDFRTVSGCSICTTAAEIIQADLQDIGINMQITALASSEYWAPYGNYQTNVANAKQLGHLSFLGGQFWAPSVLSPTDYWSSFVTSSSLWGNWAAYSNPVVDSAVANLAKSGDINTIITGLKTAQTQIYNDAPYAWIGTTSLWYVDGSFVWNKALIKQVWFDPAYTGINTAPLFNTIVFVGT